MTDFQRPCPVCGTTAHHPELKKPGVNLVRCVGCAMVFANPVPAEFATGEYYDRAGNDYYLSPAKLESDFSRVRFERELRIFRKHCPAGSILDVGCSSGAFLHQLTQRFPALYRTIGTDVSGPPLDYAESRGIPVRRGDFLKQDWGETRFDAITFWAVLEHLLEPRAFIKKAACLLNSHGFCFVLVPNYRSLATRLLAANYRYIYPQHLNYFTRETLTALIGDLFSTVEIHFTHFNPIVIWQDWRGHGRQVPNEARASLLRRTTTLKETPWLKPARLLYGASEKLLGFVGLADNVLFVLRRLKS